MKKNKKLFTTILMFVLVLSIQCTVLAATSSKGTYDLDAGDGWKHTTASDSRLRDEKETTSTKVTVYTYSKTMMSCPSFRMVNYDKNARSTEIVTAAAGKSATNESNTGTKGYGYYASVKAAWNQITDDQSIRIYFDSH